MLESVCQLSRFAGEAIMEIYNSNQALNFKQKKDLSPITSADLAAHNIIKCGLTTLHPNLPILSEEEPNSWKKSEIWDRYWLVDPLDGTKEFLSHNGEFTVNIALIEDGEAVMGVVYAPAIDVLYLAIGNAAWKEENGERQPIAVSNAHPPIVAVSRSHPDDKLKDYLNRLGAHETISLGSSLKFCLVAEGKAQIYPRFGPTNIWDTAAGHAVAVAAGAKVRSWLDQPLRYLPYKSLINPGFQVSLL